MAITPGAVVLGTVALEPNRWATVDPSGAPQLALSRWLPDLTAAGFDGLELWERHAAALPASPPTDDGSPTPAATPSEQAGPDGPDGPDGPSGWGATGAAAAPGGPAAATGTGTLPVTILSSYASFDDPDPSTRRAVVDAAVALGARAVKVNVGADATAVEAYAERLAAFVAALPRSIAVLCECHTGTVAEDPAVAARILTAVGPADRVQAIVHTHESDSDLEDRFAAYGDRITHVHVNFLDLATLTVPTLAEARPVLSDRIGTLRRLGYDGSWTLEFVSGVLGPNDHPESTVPQAIDDLTVLRAALAEAGA